MRMKKIAEKEDIQSMAPIGLAQVKESPHKRSNRPRRTGLKARPRLCFRVQDRTTFINLERRRKKVEEIEYGQDLQACFHTPLVVIFSLDECVKSSNIELADPKQVWRA